MNKTIRLTLVCAVSLFFGASMALDAKDTEKKPVVKNHDAAAAQKLIKERKKQKKDLVILDVRTQAEFDAGHLADATLLDFHSPDFKKKLAKLDRNKAYLVYCRSGNRSGKSRDAMEKLGFKEIHHLDGGFRAWSAAKLPSKKKSSK